MYTPYTGYRKRGIIVLAYKDPILERFETS